MKCGMYTITNSMYLFLCLSAVPGFLLDTSRFGEALRSLQEQLDAKNFYAFNPSFDAPTKCEC